MKHNFFFSCINTLLLQFGLNLLTLSCYTVVNTFLLKLYYINTSEFHTHSFIIDSQKVQLHYYTITNPKKKQERYVFR